MKSPSPSFANDPSRRIGRQVVRIRIQGPITYKMQLITDAPVYTADIGDVRIPMSVICHCNNCRSATGQVPSMVLITDITTVRASLLAKDEGMPAEGPLTAEQRHFAPAAEVFDSENLSARKNTSLMQYKSSPARNRWFCGRCGTQLAYSIDAVAIPEEWGWPKMLDIWLGTVDRYVSIPWRIMGVMWDGPYWEGGASKRD